MTAVALALIAAFYAAALPPVPGAVDPRVTQADIDSTICVRGYARSVRPSYRYTRQLKHWLLRGRPARLYELDHLVPLELGGAPYSRRNLWLEPWDGAWGARVKDHLENRLHRLVCRHRLPLATAQHAISADWIAAYRLYMLRP